jgi:hypothetical protein
MASSVAWYASRPSSPADGRAGAASEGIGPSRARLETRLTPGPARSVGRAARTHQIAREIPDVLDQLYCYCGCDKSAGHRSLLSCFTDGHAAT